MAQRIDRLAWTPEQGPSTALVEQVLKRRQPHNRGRLGLKSTFGVSVLGVVSGLCAGLGLKAQMASGVHGLDLLLHPMGLYACLMCLLAGSAAVLGGLPRLREFGFLSALTIAGTLMS